MRIKKFFYVGCALWIGHAYAWDANGHALITQLAYHYLTPKTRIWLHQVTQTRKASELNSESIWLDNHRYGKFKKYSSWHYVNIPYGDERYFKHPYQNNVLTAISQALTILQNRQATLMQRQFAIRVLLHTIEDLHQPLHTISYYSKRYKRGDKGGTLWKIRNKKFHGSLHQFWDQGGGWLSGFAWNNQLAVEVKLHGLSKQNCNWHDIKIEPQSWARESYELAVNKAYFPPHATHKFMNYQDSVQEITKNQIVVAACRLAATLNHLNV